MRVLMTGGGTAGHVNPALAIADLILSREPDSVIEYVGTKKGIEGRLVPKRQMILHEIRVSGLARSLSFSNVKAIWEAFHAVGVCKRLIRSFEPDVVIGTGGYVCWPLIRAAAALDVPAVLHESNAEPGFAVRKLRKQADLILVNFESTKKYLQGSCARVERVGMPVNKSAGRKNKPLPPLLDEKSCLAVTDSRSAVDTAAFGHRKCVSAPDSRPFGIISFGGSLGAHTLNLCALRLMRELARFSPEIQYIHSCGTREFPEIKARFEKEGLDRYPNLILTDYIYDMPDKMAAADLVICRSGAATLAELAHCGKAAILIPSPNVTGDQQRKNAAQLSSRGAALVLEDGEAEDKIVDTVKTLIRQRERLKDLGNAIRAFDVPDCDERIYRLISEVVRKK